MQADKTCKRHYHAPQSQSHSANTTEDCRLRASSAEASGVIVVTETYSTGARGVKEAFGEVAKSTVIFGDLDTFSSGLDNHHSYLLYPSLSYKQEHSHAIHQLFEKESLCF